MLSGYRRSKGWAANKTCYFVAEFSRPFDSVVKDEGGKVSVRVGYKDSTKPILVKVGISGVSVEAARKNLAAEIPAWDFQGTIAAAAKSWNDVLGRIDDRGHRPGHARGLLHRALPRLHGPHALQRRRRQLSRVGPQGPRPGRVPELLHVLAVGHLPGGARRCSRSCNPSGSTTSFGTMLAHYRQFKPARPAGLVARGQRDLVHDRQPRDPGDRRGLRQGFPPLRRGSRLPGDARRRDAGPQPPGPVPRQGIRALQ